jgi:hypothetical protein
MMMMADNDPLPIAQVWELAYSLKVGQTFVIEWRTIANASRTGQRWKEKRGVILQACTKGGAGKQRYASVQFEGMVRPAMFPEDGENGTQNLEYRCVELDEEEAFTPSPEKQDAAEPRNSVVPNPTSKPPIPNPRVRVMVEEARKEVEVPSDHDVASECPDEEEEAIIDAETCLDPAKWDVLTKRELDVLRAQSWIREYFLPLTRTKSQSDNIILTDLIDVLCADLSSVRLSPDVIRNSEWLRAREKALARLLIQMERAEGASTAQLNALQRGFTNRKQPEWIRQAREAGAHMMSHPDPFRKSGSKDGRPKEKKSSKP